MFGVGGVWILLLGEKISLSIEGVGVGSTSSFSFLKSFGSTGSGLVFGSGNSIFIGVNMNLFNMAKDLKGMEKMMKPALEKFMKESGFVKKEELTKLENRIKELEDKISKI